MAKLKYGTFVQGNNKITVDANTSIKEVEAFCKKNPDLRKYIVLVEDDNNKKKSSKPTKAKPKQD